MVATQSYPNSQTIHRHVLPNGITVLLYENPHSRTVVLEGGLWGGAANDTTATAGLSGFAASMLMRGTENRSFEQIYDELESVGASANVSSGYQVTEFSADSLTEDLDLTLDILADVLRYPIFDPAQADKVRSEKMTRLYMRQNDTGSMAARNFRRALYGDDHPYGRSVAGELDTIQALSVDQLKAFHARHYGPQNGLITLVGGINPEVALAKIEAAFGDWENPNYEAPAAIPPVARPNGIMRIHHDMPDKTQSDLTLGLPGPLRNAPDYDNAKLANTVLGVFGMMGRLGKTVREEQGLAYYVRSVLQGSIGPFPWYVSTGISPDKVEQALTSIQSEIRRMQNELVPEDELADSQAYLTGSLPMSLEGNSGLADIIFNMEFLGLGADYLVNYADNIRAVTPAGVQAAAQKYFSADDVVVSVAGPAQ